MYCDHLRAKFNMWSDEKKRIVFTALGGAISCKYCRKIYYMEETSNDK